MSKIILATIFLLGSAVVGFFYLEPSWKSFQELLGEEANLEESGSELDSLIQNRDFLTKTANTITKGDLGRLDLALPVGPGAEELLVLLEELAKKDDVLIKQLDLTTQVKTAPAASGQPRPGGIPVSAAKKAGLNDFPISMNVAASYQNLKSFLGDLERSLRIVDIEELSFGASTASTLDVSIRLKTYYQ